MFLTYKKDVLDHFDTLRTLQHRSNLTFLDVSLFFATPQLCNKYKRLRSILDDPNTHKTLNLTQIDHFDTSRTL